jgi:protein SCO1/2
MKNKLLFYVGFFVVLVVVFWAGLYLFTDTFNQSRLDKRSVVQPFAFIKEDGSIFTNAEMKGKVCVVNYFFTTCPSICPRMNNNMKKLYEALKDEPNLLFISHTCDPKRDSAPKMKHYADSLGVNTKQWIFLTGRKDSLYKMARFSYGIDDPKNVVANIDDDFMHSQFFALVDKNGVVRGQVYDGLKEEEMEKLKRDIKDLLKEKEVGKNFSNGMFNQ